MSAITAIRTQVEARLTGRMPAAFVQHRRSPMPTIPSGIDDIDQEIGGVPCGAITELVAASFGSSGQKTLQAKLLACATQEHVCALIDATDSFDPKSAQAMGVNLRRLLWVRCSGKDMQALEQAFQCADLVLQASGGFGVIAVDLSGIAPRFVRKVPLTTWFRFRGVIEKQETALIFSTSHTVTSTCSELVLRLAAKDVHWSQTAGKGPTHARVFAGFDLETEITRKRSFKKPVKSAARTLLTYPRWA